MESSSLFAQVIQDHLELKERNSELESEKPLDRYTEEEPPTQEQGLWSKSRDFDWGD